MKICHECENLFSPGWFHEQIPYAYGVLEYRSIYDFENLDYHQETVLYENMDKCFNFAIYNQSEFGFILLIGEKEYQSIDEWFFLVKRFDKVLFLSLFYYDFSVYEDLM